MGWSCTADAAHAMDRLSTACFEQTGIANVYEDHGARFMWERSNVEHDDGRITGTVWKYQPDGAHIRKHDRFCIGENGYMVHGTAWMRRAANPAPYQPKTGAICSCKRGQERDNCPNCEGTGQAIDFRAIHARKVTL
jgi:hypothetical protein